MSATGAPAAHRQRARWLLPFICLALAGCGGPSSSDIKAALQDMTLALLGEQMAPVIEDVSNVDCQAAQGQPGYVCSYSVTAFNKFMKTRETHTKQGHFVQNGSKWVLMH